MRDKEEFYQILLGLEQGGPDAVKGLMGDFDFSRYVLRFSQEIREADAPSLVIIRVPQSMAGFPEAMYATPLRRTALEDYLTRAVAGCLDRMRRFDASGIAKRRIFTVAPGQKILPRTAVAVDANHVEARLYVEFPMREEGLVDVGAAAELFFQDLPRVVTASLIYHNLPSVELDRFIRGMEDADAVRQLLPTRGWVGFAGEGSVLARQGSSDEPKQEDRSPCPIHEALREKLDLRTGTAWTGAGIPSGLTVIVGDEESGRRELMHALAAGIYNHIPGDGRERVVTIPDAVYIAAEPGRCLHGVNLSTFFPGGIQGHDDPSNYSSAHAEAHVAQAASLVEAIEAGARGLLLDESDSVAAFLGADAHLRRLCGGSGQDFVPLCSLARKIVDELGISIVVAGCASIGPFVPIADAVLAFRDGVLCDVTQMAKELPMAPLDAAENPNIIQELVDQSRCLVPSSIEPGWGRSEANISAEEVDLLVFGDDLVDLSGLRQLAEVAQTETIGSILRYVKTRYLVDARPIRDILDMIDRDLSSEGLDCLGRDVNGRLARPRRYEIAAVINRMPSVRVRREAE